MKLTALILTTLATTAHACDKWSFKCSTTSYLCGVSQTEAIEKGVTKYVTLEKNGDECNAFYDISSKNNLDFLEHTCPEGNTISHFVNWCSGKKVMAEDSTDGTTRVTETMPGFEGGAGGDPHFRTYDGTQYSFHGECDLVLARSAEKDLELHIRTKSMGSWSLISNAALRIGQDIFEFDNEGSQYLNGSPVALPSILAGKFGMEKFVESFENQEGERVERQIVFIDLSETERISMTLVKGMIHVRVKGYLQDAEGMLGVHGIAGLVGRDKSVLGDPNAMGAEWQVRDTEVEMFREVRFPQYPQTCVPPTASGRRLRISAAEKESAEKACASVDDFSLHFCIEDVLLSGDVSAADGYLFGEAF